LGRSLVPAGFLGRLAAVSEDTVQRALVRLRELGLLFWQRRLVRDEASGWRCEQASNAYVLTPASCDPQSAAPVQVSLKKKEAPEREQTAPEVRQGTLQALAAIATRRMRALGLA
jgi:hypothetical protein